MRPEISRAETNVVEAGTPTEDKHFRLPAVDRAIDLFELLANSRNGLTLSELSRKLDIPKSSAHYLIYTLATRGYVQRASNGRHSLGLRFADVARASTAELNLGVLASPYLRQISAKLDLTATLAVPKGAEAVIVAQATSAQDLSGGAWIGRHFDLHCTAQGKALIAALPDQKLSRLFAGRELARFTPKTITSVSALTAHLATVRADGFSINDEEHVMGGRAVAAPVLDAFGEVIAAISVRGPIGRFSTSRLPELGQEMICASRKITSQLSNH